MLRIGRYYTTTEDFEQRLIDGQLPTLDLLFFERELSQLGGISMAAGLYTIKMAALQAIGLQNGTCLDLCLLHNEKNQQKLIILKDTPWIHHLSVGFYRSPESNLAIAIGYH